VSGQQSKMPAGHASRCSQGYGYGCACDGAGCNDTAGNDTAGLGQSSEDATELALQATATEAVVLLGIVALKQGNNNTLADYAFGGAAAAFGMSVASSRKVAAARAAFVEVSPPTRST
jgi:hypothetical protein